MLKGGPRDQAANDQPLESMVLDKSEVCSVHESLNPPERLGFCWCSPVLPELALSSQRVRGGGETVGGGGGGSGEMKDPWLGQASDALPSTGRMEA